MEKNDLTSYNKYIRKKWAILLGMILGVYILNGITIRILRSATG